MKKLFLIIALAFGIGLVQTARAQQDVVAGIPVNYDESQVGDYKATLPDALVFNNGKPVKTARQWTRKRRPEIVKLFEEFEYGKWPAKRPKLRYSVQKDVGLEGLAVRKQVTVFFSPDDNGPRVDVLIYLPKNVQGPAPLLLNLSFSPNNLVVFEPGVKPGRRWDANTRTASVIATPPTMATNYAMRVGLNDVVKSFLEAGIGFATLNYTDM